MFYQRLPIRKIILWTSITVLIVVAAFNTYDRLVFRLTTTSPDLDRVATSSSKIIFRFSQPIKSVETVTINNTVVNQTVNGKEITIPLALGVLSKDEVLDISMKNIESEQFNNKIDQIDRQVIVKYIEFDELSDEQRKISIQESNSGQVDDPFMDNAFPLLDEKYRFQIDANTAGFTDTVNVTITFLDEAPDYDNGGKVTQLPNDTAEEYRKSAFELIRRHKGDPDHYDITYSNDYLNNKYPGNFHD